MDLSRPTGSGRAGPRTRVLGEAEVHGDGLRAAIPRQRLGWVFEQITTRRGGGIVFRPAPLPTHFFLLFFSELRMYLKISSKNVYISENALTFGNYPAEFAENLGEK